jgi:hypothetical protein
MTVAQRTKVGAKGWSWRGTLFRVVAVLMAFVFLVLFKGLESMLAPWIVFSDPVDHGWDRTPELHRLGDAYAGALFAILLAGSLISLLWRPREKPALVQFYVVNGAFMALSSVFFGGYRDSGETLSGIVLGTSVELLVFVTPIVATYPAFRSLFDLSRSGPASRTLLVLAVPTVVLLCFWVVGVARWHYAGGYIEGPLEEDWMSAVYAGFALVTAIALVLAKRPGWRTLGILVGAMLAYMGVASIQLPQYVGSWGVIGGVAAILGGLAFAAATLLEARNERYARESRRGALG